jgi:hypothetical protein
MLSFLLWRALIDPDPVGRLAMGLLALITVSALAFSWVNWRGAIRTSTGTTTAFLSLSLERLRRLRRGLYAGWSILAAEIAIFVPWIWHRLYAGAGPPSEAAERFAWGLLGGVTLLGVALLAGLHAWARREARMLDGLKRELGEDS